MLAEAGQALSGWSLSDLRPLLDLGLAGVFLFAFMREWIVAGPRLKKAETDLEREVAARVKAEADLAAVYESMHRDLVPLMTLLRARLDEQHRLDETVEESLRRVSDQLTGLAQAGQRVENRLSRLGGWRERG